MKCSDFGQIVNRFVRIEDVIASGNTAHAAILGGHLRPHVRLTMCR
jgi:hypothetical protein